MDKVSFSSERGPPVWGHEKKQATPQGAGFVPWFTWSVATVGAFAREAAARVGKGALAFQVRCALAAKRRGAATPMAVLCVHGAHGLLACRALVELAHHDQPFLAHATVLARGPVAFVYVVREQIVNHRGLDCPLLRKE